jgi:hypothetical protein
MCLGSWWWLEGYEWAIVAGYILRTRMSLLWLLHPLEKNDAATVIASSNLGGEGGRTASSVTKVESLPTGSWLRACAG